jgi:hypothetical protein
MTIATTTNRKQYTANGSNDTFAYDFLVLDKTHLYVYVGSTLQTEGTSSDYTVTGIANPAGGNVVFNAGTIPIADAIVTIIRTVPMTQAVDYVENEKFPANTHEQALDKLTMLVQQLEEQYSRAIILTLLSEYNDLTMPDPVAGYFLQWKADLSGLQNALALDASSVSITPFMETLLDDADVDTALKTFCLHQMIIEITDADANEIDVQGVATSGYDPDTFAKVEDIAENTPKGGITLATGGSYIKIDSDTLLSGNVLVVVGAEVIKNSTTTPVLCNGFVNTNDIQLTFYQDGNPGTVIDLGTIVDTGNGEVFVRVTYITAT